MQKRLLGNSFVVRGDASVVDELLRLVKAEEDIVVRGNPDVYVREYRHFGIEDARELRTRTSLRGSRTRRVFISIAPDINREAQNALLKTLEEPLADALLFFVVPSPETLLPTLRSRMQFLELLQTRSSNIDAEEFLLAPTQKRLDLLKPLLEKGDDDKRDLGVILSFLASLERVLELKKDGLVHVYRARKYIADRGALVKPLLEQLALLVPRV